MTHVREATHHGRVLSVFISLLPRTASLTNHEEHREKVQQK